MNSKMTNAEQFKLAEKYIPGGVNSPLRGFNEVNSNPICVSRAKGQYLYDVEGKQYTDFLLGFGPMILGHAHQCVIDALNDQVTKGSVYAATNTAEIELAQLVIESTKCIEQVRFVCSGTEAVMSAIRLAKGYTGREKILKFEGSYHGHSDAVLGQGEEANDNRNSVKGVDSSIHKNTIVVQYNDLEGVKKAFEKCGEEIACILVEPYACNMGLVIPDKEFIIGLREICDKYKTLLIFDEVITGFRINYGSVCEDFGVEPDLITFGKIIGGGLPVGAYAGKKEVMQLVTDEEQGVYQSGTFAGNSMTMTAGIATLKYLKENDVYTKLEKKGMLLESEMNKRFKENNISYVFTRKGSVFSFAFRDNKKKIRNYLDVLDQDFDLFSDVHRALLERGVLLPPSAEEVMHLCTEHTDEDIISFVDKFVECIKIVGADKNDN